MPRFSSMRDQQVRVRADVGVARRDVRQREQLAQFADDRLPRGRPRGFRRRPSPAPRRRRRPAATAASDQRAGEARMPWHRSVLRPETGEPATMSDRHARSGGHVMKALHRTSRLPRQQYCWRSAAAGIAAAQARKHRPPLAAPAASVGLFVYPAKGRTPRSSRRTRPSATTGRRPSPASTRRRPHRAPAPAARPRNRARAASASRARHAAPRPAP